jgi:hypothetical protein
MLVKTEAAYATDPLPTPAANAVLINSGIDITPQADRVERDILRDTLSPAGSAVGAKSLDLSFQVEARGGGLDGDGKPLPPDYAPALLACGTQSTPVVRLSVTGGAGTFEAGEVVTGGTSGATAQIEYIERAHVLVAVVTNGTFQAAETITGGTSGATGGVSDIMPALMYRPQTLPPSQQKSVAVYFHRDGILHRVLGVRGTCSLDAQVGKIPTWDFNLSGLWVDPADQALPSPTLTSLAGAQFLGADLMIGDYTPTFTALKLDLGNKVDRRQDANHPEGVTSLVLASRSPTGSLDPEVDKLASFNPWTAWKDSNARARINCRIGSQAGNRLHVHVGAAQYSDIKYGDRIGLSTYSISFVPTAERLGDDDTRFLFS